MKRLEIELGNEGGFCSHTVSRVVNGEYIFRDKARREKLIELLWKLEAYHMVHVRAHCMMSNHLHMLIQVPEREERLTQKQNRAGLLAFIQKCFR